MVMNCNVMVTANVYVFTLDIVIEIMTYIETLMIEMGVYLTISSKHIPTEVNVQINQEV